MTIDLEHLITRDTALCAAMADDIEAYLKSNELFWEPNRVQLGGLALPKLTFGGLFLSKRRLETLRDHLDPDQAETLERAGRELAFQKEQWRPRYENKLGRELRSRLDEWAWYLDDCQRQGESAIDHYVRRVETRAKIDLLLEEIDDLGLDVSESRHRKDILDQRLWRAFSRGAFFWIEDLMPGFPADRFWYLYGFPRED